MNPTWTTAPPPVAGIAPLRASRMPPAPAWWGACRNVSVWAAACALLGLAICGAAAGDWRHDLLECSGIPTARKDIEAALEARQAPEALHQKAYAKLGSENFHERERAQAELLAGGMAALDWLKAQDISDDPEVRIRSHHIMRALVASPPAMRESLLLHAMRSLLEDPRGADTGGVFYEWFGTDAADCRNGYRQMRAEGLHGRLSEVSGGRLLFLGGRPGEADQRLVLDARQWPGRERFPDHLTVRVLLGGGNGGSGGWHVAVSIGNVKTLFHPEFRGGAFRHEKVATHEKITLNTGMGFTPEAGELLDMTLELDRADDAGFSLKTVILRQDGTRFENQTRIAEEHFGGFESIGLERSGKSGGNAHFEQLSVTLRER